MNRSRLLLAPVALILIAAQAPGRQVDPWIASPRLNPASAAEVTANCDAGLAQVAALRRAFETERSAASAATFRGYDDLMMTLGTTSGEAGLISNLGADAPRRDAARACLAKVSAAGTGIALSRAIYDRLKAIPANALDPAGRHLLKRTLLQYEQSGINRDEATRAKIAVLSDELTKIALRFSANIANGRKTIAVDPSELEGLPADYLAAHKPSADGKVVISTDTPDYSPVMRYAKNEGLRKRLHLTYATRAWPDNDAVLRELLAKRHELAMLLGQPDWATLALRDKMIGTPARARAFIQEAAAAAEAPAKRDYARLLERARKETPGATTVPAWSTTYLAEIERKERYALDAQEVRRYFAYDRVRDGMLQLTRDLFGVEIKPWKTAVWDPSVEAYEMFDGGRLIGRFYFDAHPRSGKFSHAAVTTPRAGVKGRVVPVAALMTNFPSGAGLMEHRDVETFLHEYGHLIHAIFAGGQDYYLASHSGLEWDAIEAPSQMLENWVWDYDTLARFAKDAEGRPIPKPLVERMNAARYFGEAMGDRTQLGFSTASLNYHSGPPADDLTRVYRDAVDGLSMVPIAEGAHPHTAWTHMTGYSAYYYTYMWSKTISTDLFTRFEKEGLRNPAVARAYRAQVLAPGSSKPATALIEGFLGRPTTLDAYRARLAKGA